MNKKALIYLGCMYAMALSFSVVAAIDKEADFYTILGLDSDASKEKIEKAKKKLSLKFHSDKLLRNKIYKNGSKEVKEKMEKEFGEKMELINLAAAVLGNEGLSNENTKSIYDKHVYKNGKGGKKAWMVYREAQRDRKIIKKIDVIKEEFKSIKEEERKKKTEEKKLLHDKKGRNYLQRIYIDAREYFTPTISANSSVPKDLKALMKVLEEPYQEKTIFYQALEDNSMDIIKSLLYIESFDDDGNIQHKNFLNHHPQKKPHPIELFLQISEDQFGTLAYYARKTVNHLRIEFLQKFVENGPDEEGKRILNKYEEGKRAFNCQKEKEKIETEFKDRKNIKNGIIWHDDENMNYLQRYYTYSPINFDISIAGLTEKNKWAFLKSCLEERYQGKTIFYQALEDKNIQVIITLLNVIFLDHDSNLMYNNFLNHHPEKKPHPIELFLQIRDDRFSALAYSTMKSVNYLRTEALKRFVKNGLDKEGQRILDQHNRQGNATKDNSNIRNTGTNDLLGKKSQNALNAKGKPALDQHNRQGNATKDNSNIRNTSTNDLLGKKSQNALNAKGKPALDQHNRQGNATKDNSNIRNTSTNDLLGKKSQNALNAKGKPALDQHNRQGNATKDNSDMDDIPSNTSSNQVYLIVVISVIGLTLVVGVKKLLANKNKEKRKLDMPNKSQWARQKKRRSHKMA